MTTATQNFANLFGHSDIRPYEIVKRISDKTIEIREMKAERDQSVQMHFHVGGFMAHCSNQNEQKWVITSDDTNPVIRCRIQKDGTWKSAYGKHRLSDTPRKFYDYNF